LNPRTREILIASNRGPVSFVREGDRIVPHRGGGGLVAALVGAMQRRGGRWIASAMSDEDREVATEGIELPRIGGEGTESADGDGPSTSLRYLPFDPGTYEGFYNGISNRILWFVHHYLWDVPREPRFDQRTRVEWAAYRTVNRAFADALAEEGFKLGGDPVHLVQDYHLSLVPRLVRIRMPNAPISYFSHIPFAGPTYIGMLPNWMREDLLAGLLGADVVGFQSDHWADNFLLACRTLPGTRVNLRRRLVLWEGREVRVRVYPVAVDRVELRTASELPEVAAEREALLHWLGSAHLILRADRVELSKNVLRGLLAYEELLIRHPQWRKRVKMLAFLDPSREDVPEYRAYAQEVTETAERIDRELGETGWQPIRLEIDADRSRLLAAYGIYDVLLVNPVFDGLNLVAKEGVLLNGRRGVLVLSQNAGAFPELERFALRINPFDVGQTVDALSNALQMSDAERGRRARGLRASVLRTSPDGWISRQLQDVDAGLSA
jgi:trehalose 6-phosphate synthase